MRLGAALLLLAAPAAGYSPDPARYALRQAADASYRSVGFAAGLSLEFEKVTFIKAHLDDAVRHAQAATTGAATLNGLVALATTAMEQTLKGKSSLGSLEKAVAQRRDAAAAEKRRGEQLARVAQDLRGPVERLPERDKNRALGLLNKSLDEIREAERALSEADGKARAMEEAARRMNDAWRRAVPLQNEVGKAAAETIRAAQALESGASEAKARLAKLGVPPLNESRTRAWEKIDPLRDAARVLVAGAETAYARSDDLKRYSGAFDKDEDAFIAALKAADVHLESAKRRDDAASDALARVRERLP